MYPRPALISHLTPPIMLFIAIGLFTGIISGLVGIGGGVVIVPSLALLAKFPIKTAVGTSLGALLLPVGIFGAMTYHKAGNLNVKAAALIAAGLVVGVFLGAQIVQHISDTQLRKFFAVFLLVIAVKLWMG
jgi:uncharacterized membrane protein YfcA